MFRKYLQISRYTNTGMHVYNRTHQLLLCAAIQLASSKIVTYIYVTNKQNTELEHFVNEYRITSTILRINTNVSLCFQVYNKKSGLAQVCGCL